MCRKPPFVWEISHAPPALQLMYYFLEGAFLGTLYGCWRFGCRGSLGGFGGRGGGQFGGTLVSRFPTSCNNDQKERIFTIKLPMCKIYHPCILDGIHGQPKLPVFTRKCPCVPEIIQVYHKVARLSKIIFFCATNISVQKFCANKMGHKPNQLVIAILHLFSHCVWSNRVKFGEHW